MKKATSKREWLRRYECEKTLASLCLKNVPFGSPMWVWWYDYAVGIGVNVLAVKEGGFEPWK